jgi:hypothetical protein
LVQSSFKKGETAIKFTPQNGKIIVKGSKGNIMTISGTEAQTFMEKMEETGQSLVEGGKKVWGHIPEVLQKGIARAYNKGLAMIPLFGDVAKEQMEADEKDAKYEKKMKKYTQRIELEKKLAEIRRIREGTELATATNTRSIQQQNLGAESDMTTHQGGEQTKRQNMEKSDLSYEEFKYLFNEKFKDLPEATRRERMISREDYEAQMLTKKQARESSEVKHERALRQDVRGITSDALAADQLDAKAKRETAKDVRGLMSDEITATLYDTTTKRAIEKEKRGEKLDAAEHEKLMMMHEKELLGMKYAIERMPDEERIAAEKMIEDAMTAKVNRKVELLSAQISQGEKENLERQLKGKTAIEKMEIAAQIVAAKHDARNLGATLAKKDKAEKDAEVEAEKQKRRDLYARAGQTIGSAFSALAGGAPQTLTTTTTTKTEGEGTKAGTKAGTKGAKAGTKAGEAAAGDAEEGEAAATTQAAKSTKGKKGGGSGVGSTITTITEALNPAARISNIGQAVGTVISGLPDLAEAGMEMGSFAKQYALAGWKFVFNNKKYHEDKAEEERIEKQKQDQAVAQVAKTQADDEAALNDALNDLG